MNYFIPQYYERRFNQNLVDTNPNGSVFVLWLPCPTNNG